MANLNKGNLKEHFFNLLLKFNLFYFFLNPYSALRISLIQLKIGMNKTENVGHALNCIRKTVEKDQPKVVALPECFNSPYGTKYFNEYAENIPDGYTSQALSNIAKELNVYLVGGTIPERDDKDNKLYNTCTVWSPSGDLIAKYRKVVFDLFRFENAHKIDHSTYKN